MHLTGREEDIGRSLRSLKERARERLGGGRGAIENLPAFNVRRWRLVSRFHGAQGQPANFHVSKASLSAFIILGNIEEGKNREGERLVWSVDVRATIVGPLDSLSYGVPKERNGLVLPGTIVPVNLCLVSRLFSHLFTRPRQKGERLPSIPCAWSHLQLLFLPSFALFSFLS